jgi:type IV secretory pathway VirB6-like protein
MRYKGPTIIITLIAIFNNIFMKEDQDEVCWASEYPMKSEIKIINTQTIVVKSNKTLSLCFNKSNV